MRSKKQTNKKVAICKITIWWNSKMKARGRVAAIQSNNEGTNGSTLQENYNEKKDKEKKEEDFEILFFLL